MNTEQFAPKEPSFTVSIEELLANKQTYANFLDFQRDSVWPLGKKRLFIEGILRGYHIPEFPITKRGEHWAFVDGKQRVLTIFEFAADGFTTFKKKENPPYGSVDPNKLDSQLDPQWQSMFTHSILSFHVIAHMEEWMLADYYRWLQYHQPLFLPEKLWTYPSQTTRQATKLLEHPFWRSIYHGSQNHKRAFLGCYYTILLEVTDFGEHITQCRLREFASGVEDNSVNSVLIETINRRLDLAAHIFHGTSLKDLREVIPVYQAVSILENAKVDLGQLDRGCLTSWYKKIQEDSIQYRQKYKEPDDLLKMTRVSFRSVFWDQQEKVIIEAVKSCYKGQTQQKQEKRIIQGIDPQLVVDRQHGNCPLCDGVIEDLFAGDYVLQYKSGDPITVENCAVVHRVCHQTLTQKIPNLGLVTVEITRDEE